MRLWALIAAVLLSALIVSSASIAGAADDIRFTIELARYDGRVHATFRSGDSDHDNHWSSDFAAGELAGLDLSRLHAPGSGPVRFAIQREAGRLDCAGNGGNAMAVGRCNFTADEGFANYLAARGMRRPSSREAFTMMAVNVRRDLIEALSGARYPTPSVDNLVALTALGANGRYINDLARVGYRPETLDALIQFKALGITADYIGGYVRMGYGNIPSDQLVQLKALDIDAAYVAGFDRIGYGRIAPDELVQLKALGITPEWVQGFQRLGFRHIPVSKLVEMKAVGVDADYVRAVQQGSAETLTPDRLVQLRAIGYRPSSR